MQQRIAVIGAGSVGSALAAGLTAARHQVAFGVREPDQAKYSDLPVAATTISDSTSPSSGDATRSHWSRTTPDSGSTSHSDAAGVATSSGRRSVADALRHPSATPPITA